jgi:hydrogenase maturation factor
MENGQLKLIGRTENLEKGQTEIISQTEILEKGVGLLIGRTENLKKGQEKLIGRTENVEIGVTELIGRTENLEKGQDILSSGQNEIKELIKHTATLMTENFTYIRKDMKAFALDVHSDVELLFKEMADVRRKYTVIFPTYS